MNYKIMTRPMFRLGGQAKRPGYQNSNYQDLLKQIRQDLSRRTENRDQYLKGIKRVLPLSVLASSSGIGQIRKPMDVVNLLSEIGTNPRTYEALMKSKSIDMKMDEGALKDKISLAKLLKPSGSFGQKVYEMKLANIGELEKQVDDLKTKLDAKEITKEEYDREMVKINRRFKLNVGASFRDDQYFIEQARTILDSKIGIGSYSEERLLEEARKLKELSKRTLSDGGRVDYQDGTPNPNMIMPQPKPQEVIEDRKVEKLMKEAHALENPGEVKQMAMKDEDMYAALRRRLPPEITDDVVRLIAYNQEAFADFANISDQSDVESFNQKYNVELVLPVGNQ